MEILKFSELMATQWPAVDLAEEFADRLLKIVHFNTRLQRPSCNLLQVLTPSSASSIQDMFKNAASRANDNAVLFLVTPVGSLTIPLLEEAVKSACPSQVLLDPDTFAPDLKAEFMGNLKQVIWMDDTEPPTDWDQRMLSELGI